MIKNLVFILFLINMLIRCQNSNTINRPNIASPIATIKPHEIISKHGHKRIDNYFWLREREDSAVINYLKAENAYTQAMMEHTKAFQEKLFTEMKGRIKEADESVPYKIDHYYYYTRMEKGGEYAIHCRKKETMQANEEIIANGNELSKGHEFFHLLTSPSPDHRMAALGIDTVGRRFYTLLFKDMNTSKMLADRIPETAGNFEWGSDSKTIYYSKQDPTTLRADKIYKHVFGTPSEKDILVYTEHDATLSCYINKSRSKKFLLISSSRTDANVVRYMELNNPNASLKTFEPLKDNVHYSIDHINNKFYMLTNNQASNYKLVEIPEYGMDKKIDTELIPNRSDIFLESFELFKDYLVVQETVQGLNKIRVINWNDKTENNINFDESAYMAGIGNNPDPNSHMVRYYYQSMTTPPSQYDYDIKTKEKKLLKEQEVLGGFDRHNYHSERVMVTARDGAQIPVSLVYRKDRFNKNGTLPGFQYAYGSYGSSIPAYFSSSRLSLLDRGFVFAIAHIRGGQEMGGKWYDDGKMMKKKNTFNDFIDVSEFLITTKYVSPTNLFANGGSAGGLLMGAIVNLRPDLYKGVIANVPFVDVITTMQDETIPLTTFEWKEWGNPNIQAEYEYMLSYSPYDNVERKNYPNMLVTTGLHDSQVQYWEPAKWVAKLRALKTDKNVLMLKTNMDAGHGGASGRFESLKENALMYAFVCDLAGVTD